MAFLVLIVASLAISCKTSQTESTQPTFDLSLLLEKNREPSQMEELKKLKIKDMKRISRSQNLWMITVKSDASPDVVKASLDSLATVIEVKILTNDEQSKTNSTNTKKATSKPIKN